MQGGGTPPAFIRWICDYTKKNYSAAQVFAIDISPSRKERRMLDLRVAKKNYSAAQIHTTNFYPLLLHA